MRFTSKLQRLALLLAVGAVTLGVSAGVAAASDPVTSITTVLYGNAPGFPSFSATPPFVTHNLPGSFTAFSGSVVVDSAPLETPPALVASLAVLPIPPPQVTQIETLRTITTSNGRLKLHCSDISRPGIQHNTYMTTGSCAVQRASGVYSGLAGSAKLTGVIDNNAGTLTDTIVF